MKIRISYGWLAIPVIAAFCTAVDAKVVTKTISYEHDGTKMQGYLAYDDAKRDARPGVLVVDEWWGLTDYGKGRARQLAEMGYVAFVADMYGDGQNTRDPKQAKAWSSAAMSQPGLLAARSKAGLDVLRKQSGVDTNRISAIGFCFGGSTVLQLAYSGEKLQGVVTLHGGLAAPNEAQAQQIKTPILVLQGAQDPFVKPETIAEMQKAFDAAKVDWYMVTYAQAVHAYSNPEADSFKIPGIGYNAQAATRSWDEMTRFFQVQFRK